MGSVKRTNEEWVKLFEQQSMSGQTLKAWCAEIVGLSFLIEIRMYQANLIICDLVTESMISIKI